MRGVRPHKGGGPYKFTPASCDRFGQWADNASSDDLEAAAQALMRVVEDSWWEHYEFTRDVIHPLTWNVLIKPGLIIEIRFATEYPTSVQLIYIGDLSGQHAL